jgi:hypothetical protein
MLMPVADSDSSAPQAQEATMLDLTLWKVIHVVGALTVFMALGGLVALGAAGPERQRLFKALHGIGLLVVLVAGFAMLGRLGMGGPGTWGTWVWIKLVVFALLGASLVAIRRAERWGHTVLLALLLLGAVATWAALSKP